MHSTCQRVLVTVTCMFAFVARLQFVCVNVCTALSLLPCSSTRHSMHATCTHARTRAPRFAPTYFATEPLARTEWLPNAANRETHTAYGQEQASAKRQQSGNGGGSGGGGCVRPHRDADSGIHSKTDAVFFTCWLNTFTFTITLWFTSKGPGGGRVASYLSCIHPSIR